MICMLNNFLCCSSVMKEPRLICITDVTITESDFRLKTSLQVQFMLSEINVIEVAFVGVYDT